MGLRGNLCCVVMATVALFDISCTGIFYVVVVDCCYQPLSLSPPPSSPMEYTIVLRYENNESLSFTIVDESTPPTATVLCTSVALLLKMADCVLEMTYR